MESNSTVDHSDSWLESFLLNVAVYIVLVVPGWLLIHFYRKKLLATPSSPSNGPLDSLLRFCILGNVHSELEIVEEGGKQPSSTSDSTSGYYDNHCSRSSLWRRGLQLVFCIMGLQLSYLTWGIIQERIVTGSYSGIEFHNSQFLVFANRVLALLSSGLFLYVTTQPKHVSPFYKYSFSSLSNIISSWCQYEALKFISFPTQVLAKCCKVIPVMIMGKIVSNKTYPLHEYITATMISMGVSLFLLTTSNRSTVEQDDEGIKLTGILILIWYLVFDSFTSNWQSELFREYKMSPVQMMFGTNAFSFTFTAFSLLVEGKLFPPLIFMFNQPELAIHVLVLSACSACGQLFIFYTISSFGPVVFTLIMTSRQAVSIIISCIVYGHILSPLAVLGVVVVFGSVLLRVYLKQRMK